ncbi:MAG: RsmD family RNA methyltransferase [Muribaculaceae bacterium]|nr:RsmD family RNA methyltransferase [Muribaculaceae bacterium]
MTAGLGIDAMTFATIPHREVTAIELDKKKAEILCHNAEVLNLKNLKVINGDSIEFLNSNQKNYDLIFIDPSRIDSNHNRVYNLKDCGPDVIKFQDLILSHARRVFIKASPMLDISQTIKDFHNLRSLRAVGVKGECKEVLIELASPTELTFSSEEIILEAIDLDGDGNIISCFSCASNIPIHKIEYASSDDLKPGNFLLEPSAMMMKISPWSRICEDFKAKKIGRSSHLFISEEKPEGFQGRVSRLVNVISKKDRKNLFGLPASIVSRNHPLSADEIRKSYKLKEGDNNFIYATRLNDKPILVLSETITHR